jgi:hypothetical protein
MNKFSFSDFRNKIKIGWSDKIYDSQKSLTLRTNYQANGKKNKETGKGSQAF